MNFRNSNTLKKKLRVVLAHVTPISQFPVGIGMVAAIFEEEGCEVIPIINNFINYQNIESLGKSIIALKPDIVGISFQTFGVKINYSLVKLLKKESLFIVGGGNHLSLFPEEGIENGFDVSVIGEGEGICRELVRHVKKPFQFPLSKIKGISFRDKDGKTMITESAPVLENLDSLPFPARHLFNKNEFLQRDGELKGYGKIFTGRGCSARCTFCCPNVFGRTFRHRSAKNVVDEIEQVKNDFNINIFTIIDDTFLLKIEHVKEICHEILERKLKIQWNCCARVNNMPEDLLTLMKQSGCFMMNFGIESGDPDTLKKIKKGISVKKVMITLKATKDAGIKTYANFMTGFPWETPAQIDNTTKLIKQISPWVDQFSNKGVLIPEPGTEMYEQLKSNYNIDNYWLKDRYQNVGASIFQNVSNPYKISNWFQRNMYDDTYVRESIFFNFSSDQKKAIYRLARTIGLLNLKKKYGSTLKALFLSIAGLTSFYLSEINSKLEPKIVSLFMKSGAKLHGGFGIGYSKKIHRNNK